MVEITIVHTPYFIERSRRGGEHKSDGYGKQEKNFERGIR